MCIQFLGSVLRSVYVRMYVERVTFEKFNKTFVVVIWKVTP